MSHSNDDGDDDYDDARWRLQMETFSALLAICARNSQVPGEFPAQSPVTRSFDVFFDLCLNKRLSKQWWGWWFETLPRPLWRHSNGLWCCCWFIDAYFIYSYAITEIFMVITIFNFKGRNLFVCHTFETTEYHINQSANYISAGWLALGNTNQLFLSFRMNVLEIWRYPIK